ncbi:MAG: adenylate/guanylate cyclase domain-containing protein [Spirochaetaceae bacterium]
MDIKNKILDFSVALIPLIWFFMPIALGPVSSGIVFSAFSLPVGFLGLLPGTIYGFMLYLIYLIPLFSIIRITTTLLVKKIHFFTIFKPLFFTIALFFISLIMLYSAIIPILMFAETREYFDTMSITSIILILISFILNVLSVTQFVIIINKNNSSYNEYVGFKANQKLDKVRNLNFFNKIRSKLLISFIGIISLILLIMSTQLLNNYKTTLLKAIGDGAKSQVEQTAAIYRINLGDNIALFEYFNRQVELNEKANFKYDNLSIYTNLKEGVYIDAIENAFPDYPIEYSTLSLGVRYPDIGLISGDLAREYLSHYSEVNTTYSFIEPGQFKYISPIIKIDTIKNGDEKIKKSRLLGFSIMTFSEDVIMKPYFKIRNLVMVMTFVFIYLSIILTLLVGNYIVNPILYLRMNVRKVSDILSQMIKGEQRISSTSLVFNDNISSKDEIKTLSSEIENMVTIIRGIVPYISASTLKQAETGASSSKQKDLAFLFTDIRGFTTLCEGMEPDEVVGVLNQYLDLETEIIINNHGDVDKFVGDEMMAFFEGPDREANACRAAMEIRSAMMNEKDRREKAGLTVVSIGIGINTGPVVFGSVGAKDRMDFTSIGDTVNLAARLEGANKAYGSKSLISEAVYTQVKDIFLCRELDSITVKGKNKPVRIYEILQEHKNAIPKIFELKELFESGLVEYRQKNWDAAKVHFEKNIELYHDAPSKVFLDRVNHFSKNPPAADWDGVFRMTIK